MQTSLSEPASPPPAFLERRRTADRIFKGALIFNTSLTVFWLVMLATGGNAFFFGSYDVNLEAVGRVLGGVFFFYVLWGFIWYGVKSLLLTYFVRFSQGGAAAGVLVADEGARSTSSTCCSGTPNGGSASPT